MKIKEIMTVDVATLDPDATIEQAARLMRDANVGFAPVVSGGMVLGVLTDRDIVVRAAARGLHIKVATVLDILTPGAVHCFEDDDVESAAALMEDNRVRRLIVVKADNTLAGILALSDIDLHAGGASAPGEEATSMRGAGVSETGDAPDVRRGHVHSLLRRELSAVETYKLALAKVAGQTERDELWRIEREHEAAFDLLLADLRRRGHKPPLNSGLRGVWSKVYEGTAMLFGNRTAIKALKSREQLGLLEYEDALADEELDPEVRALIRSRLLPQARAHLPALDRILAAVP